MIKIPLHSRKYPGLFTVIDDADEDLVRSYPRPWGVANTSGKGTNYAMSWGGPGCSNVYLHRFLLEPPPGLFVDHIDRDGLNNRRYNLRLTTQTNNNRNVGMRSHNTSGRKGVVWDRTRAKWKAQMTLEKKCIYLGRYNDLDEAARAYDKAAREAFGEFAVLNFPD